MFLRNWHFVCTRRASLKGQGLLPVHIWYNDDKKSLSIKKAHLFLPPNVALKMSFLFMEFRMKGVQQYGTSSNSSPISKYAVQERYCTSSWQLVYLALGSSGVVTRLLTEELSLPSSHSSLSLKIESQAKARRREIHLQQQRRDYFSSGQLELMIMGKKGKSKKRGQDMWITPGHEMPEFVLVLLILVRYSTA